MGLLYRLYLPHTPHKRKIYKKNTILPFILYRSQTYIPRLSRGCILETLGDVFNIVNGPSPFKTATFRQPDVSFIILHSKLIT
jgi:hypothetical protein